MTRDRAALPMLEDRLFLTDGGSETWLIFDRGLDLPEFASYPLLATADGRAIFAEYLKPYLKTARELGCGFVMETPTWRASADWGAKLGHDATELDRLNRLAVAEAVAARAAAALDAPVVISGNIGPRRDAYIGDTAMTTGEAAEYHHAQIATFADTEADLVTALTITNVEEATGLALASQALRMPIVIGFTVETDGRLPTGATLADAITAVDAATESWPSYYLINCAHPTHFVGALDPGAAWARRIRALRANASTMSHAELDEAEELDAGDPADLAARYRLLRDTMPWISVVGGCCGTDHRHVDAIGRALSG